MVSEALGMSAPTAEGAKSCLSIMEVAGNTVNVPKKINFAFIFPILRGARGGWKGKGPVLQIGRRGKRQR